MAAVSASNVWAGGSTAFGAGAKTLIVHWNGTAWKRVPSLVGGVLAGVAATSAKSAWAVGNRHRGGATIVHWNGAVWKRVPSDIPPAGQLSGVAFTSAGNAWAAGALPNVSRTLIVHWNGTGWRQVRSPTPANGGIVFGVAATSARNAWAVGGAIFCGSSAGCSTLIVHWNGTAWKRVPSPTPAGGGTLFGVAATSARNAWGVGTATDTASALILLWNATAWK